LAASIKNYVCRAECVPPPVAQHRLIEQALAQERNYFLSGLHGRNILKRRNAPSLQAKGNDFALEPARLRRVSGSERLLKDRQGVGCACRN
jgi:hypothetical protein